MSESVPPLPLRPEGSPPGGAQTAGALLRQARQSRGLHIAALATAIKVTPQKLEALENDRLDELPGATFARALAQTVCRFLKIDPAPVLALLPQTADEGLVRISQGLNAPFRDRPGRRPPRDLSVLKNPGVIGALVLMLAAILVYLVPGDWVPRAPVAVEEESTAPTTDEPVLSMEPGLQIASAPLGVAETADTAAADGAASAAGSSGMATPADPVASAALAPVEALALTPATVRATPPVPAASPEAAASVPVDGALQLRTRDESWIEVTDRRGRSLLSRLVQAGESLTLDGNPPLRVKVGNASATTLIYKGQAIDLEPLARDNVARVELK